MSEPHRVTEEQIAAAQLRLRLDEKSGRRTAAVIRRIAGMRAGDVIGTAPVMSRLETALVRALGIATVDPKDWRKRITFFHSENDPLPQRTTETFMTVQDGQRAITIEIWQQNSDILSENPEHNILVGEVTFDDLPSLPAGAPIDVVFLVSEELELTVEALEPRSGARIHTVVPLGSAERASRVDVRFPQ
jgi:molecular chaperone DnaK (HSP70)